jgi:type IV secretion system protein TrbL
VNDLGVIDQFTNVFSHYIDSGFGLLGGEVAWLSATLVVIDIALAGLFWALAPYEDVIAKLIRKTLYIGTFAFILGNFNTLATVVLRSFASLGLLATGTGLTAGDLLRPGRLAAAGVDAARPILHQISELSGFPAAFFLNLDSIVVLLLAWLIVIISFFILAVQLFVTIIEFKLTTLAGFVLVPFAFWNKTAFLAERVLGNVVSSGVKVLVLAVIVGIGTNLFGQLVAPAGVALTIDNALAIMLAALALLGLGLFGPGIATGLVSGAPQLGAGAAAGTALVGGGLVLASTTAAAGAARLAGGAGVRAATSLAQGYSAFKDGVVASGTTGAASVGPGLAQAARAGGEAVAAKVRSAMSRFGDGASAAGTETPSTPDAEPGWAQRLRRSHRVSEGVQAAAHTVRGTDHGGSGASPNLTKED